MTKQELAAKIWATANELRKNIKASEYKDYILGFMFYKYLCDKQMDYLHDLGGSIDDLIDADETTKDMFKDRNGYYIAYNDLFFVWKNLGTKLGAKNVSEALDNFYLCLNGRYKTVFENVFSALQTGLSKLGENSGSRDQAVRNIVDLVDLIPPTSRNFDVLGYIYEYLIQQFSSEAKKDGAFYTPHELTSLMARIIAQRLKNRDAITVYDPTVGSAGLLLNMGSEAGRYVPKDNIKYYGQELITETVNLAKMNLFMQGVPIQNINMRNANTLAEDWPYFDAQTAYSPLFVDAVVSNPPYSAHYEPGRHLTDERFKGYGLAPEGKADYAFLLHCLYHVKPDGLMAIVLPHGVLFRGDSEGEIRKNLVLNHNIETIISMPSQLFFATSIPVIVMVLSKNRQEDDILFVDASQSYKKEKKQNVLTQSDIQRIFDAVVARKDVPGYAHLASMEEIKGNDFNLNVPRYISAAAEESPYDLYSVMTGKVSDKELDKFHAVWEQFPGLRQKLVSNADGYNDFSDIDCRKIVFDDDGVRGYLEKLGEETETFREYLKCNLLNKNATPAIYDAAAQKLFEDFQDLPLADVYSVFQAFADNWNQIDADLARIKEEGWGICSETEPNMVTKKDARTKKTVEEQKGFKGKIIPFDLVKQFYFSADFDEMDRLLAKADEKVSECGELWESLDDESKSEVSKEEDETAFDTKKFNSAIKSGRLGLDAVKTIKAIQKAIAEEKAFRKQVKTMEAELEEKAKNKVEALTEDEIEVLLEAKWIKPVIDSMNNVGQEVLTNFVSAFLATRKKYSDPMSELSEHIEKTGADLKASLRELTGNDKDMAAIKMLLEEL